MASRTDAPGRPRKLYAAADPVRGGLYLGGRRRPNALYWITYAGTLSPGREPALLFEHLDAALERHHS